MELAPLFMAVLKFSRRARIEIVEPFRRRPDAEVRVQSLTQHSLCEAWRRLAETKCCLCQYHCSQGEELVGKHTPPPSPDLYTCHDFLLKGQVPGWNPPRKTGRCHNMLISIYFPGCPVGHSAGLHRSPIACNYKGEHIRRIIGINFQSLWMLHVNFIYLYILFQDYRYFW